MIPHGHRHTFQAFNVWDRPDGAKQTDSRCQCANDPVTVLEQRVLERDGKLLKVSYRFGGMWFDALDLLRIALPVEECHACYGQPGIPGMPPCETCSGVGVIERGAAVAAPELDHIV